jgi:hypothetical protein
MEGLLALDARALDLDLDDARCLARLVQTLDPPAAILLTGPHAWGDRRLDRALHHLAADPKAQQTLAWARRNVGEERWPAVPVWTVLDVTPMLDGAPTLKQLALECTRLAGHPAPNELVIENPPLHALDGSYLDELALRLGCSGVGWIYIPADADPSSAIHAISRAATRWGLRRS